MKNSSRSPLALAPGLYALVDTRSLGARDPLGFTRRILAGPTLSAVQLRAKNLGAREVLSLARAMAELCSTRGVPFFVNDRPDVARLAGADGVHVGMTDLPVSEVRSIAPGCWVGASSHDDPEVAEVRATDADYLAFGPVFGTRSKENPAPTVGVAGLARTVRALREDGDGRPVVAIGGITLTNASEVRGAGARSGAVISALLVHDDEVTERARALHRLLGGE